MFGGHGEVAGVHALVPFEIGRKLEHFRLAEESGCSVRFRRSLCDDLRYALAIVTAYSESVVAMLERPVVTPEHPG